MWINKKIILLLLIITFIPISVNAVPEGGFVAEYKAKFKEATDTGMERLKLEMKDDYEEYVYEFEELEKNFNKIIEVSKEKGKEVNDVNFKDIEFPSPIIEIDKYIEEWKALDEEEADLSLEGGGGDGFSLDVELNGVDINQVDNLSSIIDGFAIEIPEIIIPEFPIDLENLFGQFMPPSIEIPFFITAELVPTVDEKTDIKVLPLNIFDILLLPANVRFIAERSYSRDGDVRIKAAKELPYIDPNGIVHVNDFYGSTGNSYDKPSDMCDFWGVGVNVDAICGMMKEDMDAARLSAGPLKMNASRTDNTIPKYEGVLASNLIDYSMFMVKVSADATEEDEYLKYTTKLFQSRKKSFDKSLMIEGKMNVKVNVEIVESVNRRNNILLNVILEKLIEANESMNEGYGGVKQFDMRFNH